MDLSRFEQGLPSLYDDLYTSDYPCDRRLQLLCQQVEGMATENKLMLLNFAASLLDHDEIYLEVGSWKGLSLIGAMVGNDGKSFSAVENFSEFDGARDELIANLDRYQLTEGVTLIEGNCFKVFQTDFIGSKKIGVYFYDGHHGYASHYKALRDIEPFLADEALVIIDDTSHPRISAANAHFIKYHPNFRLLFDILSEYNGEPKWWNGIQVYTYRRQSATTKLQSYTEIVRFIIFQVWYDLILLQTTFLIKRIKWIFGRSVKRLVSVKQHMTGVRN